MAKYSNSKTNKSKSETKLDIYNSMCELKKDLYYKDIIAAHKDKIEEGTNFQIKDITWRFNKKHISIHEMFNELEALKSGHKVTDVLVKNAMVYAKKNYCKGKNKISHRPAKRRKIKS